MANLLQIKRGNAADIPILAEGELGYTTDTHTFYIGDGTSNHQVSMHEEYNANSILKADSTGTPSALSVAEGDIVGRKAGGTINALSGSDIMEILSDEASSDFSLNDQKITGLADGTVADDAATKGQIDVATAGLDAKDSVKVATTANISISSPPSTVDGVSVADGDRILVKDQSDSSENGIYIINGGSWSRADDADSDSDVTAGLYCWVTEGTDNADSGFVITTNDPITVDTTDITFTKFTGLGQITAGTNLNLVGSTLSVSPQGDGSGLYADTLDGKQLANITWSDLDIDETDVEKGDVDLGSVTDNAQIAKDGTIAFIGDQSMGGFDLTNINAAGFEEIATPGNPASNHNKLFFKSDDELYMLDDAGNEEQVSGASVDEAVAVDSSAVPGYLGDASNNGVLQTGSLLSYADNGDSIELDVNTGTLLEDDPTNGETAEAPTSNWAYTHKNATSNVHGAGAGEVLLNDYSIIDGGLF